MFGERSGVPPLSRVFTSKEANESISLPEVPQCIMSRQPISADPRPGTRPTLPWPHSRALSYPVGVQGLAWAPCSSQPWGDAPEHSGASKLFLCRWLPNLRSSPQQPCQRHVWSLSASHVGAPHCPMDQLFPQLCPNKASKAQPRDSQQLLTHFLQRARPAGCDIRAWKLQENKVAFFKAPKRLRRCFTLLLGLSAQCFGVFGSKIRLLKGSLCICFLCLYIFQSLLPQFADFVTMAFKAPLERTAAVREALTCIAEEQKGFRAGGSATLYIKIAPGSIAPWQPCTAPRSLQSLWANADCGPPGEAEGYGRDECPQCPLMHPPAHQGQCVTNSLPSLVPQDGQEVSYL